MILVKEVWMQVDLSPHIEWMSEWMNEWMAIWMEAAVMQSIRVGGATRRAFYNGTLAFGATKSVTDSLDLHLHKNNS